MGKAEAKYEAEPLDWKSPATIKNVGAEVFREFQRDKVTTLAAAVAYHTVFAIPPLLLLVVLGAALVHQVSDVDIVSNLRDTINERAPADTQSILNEQVDRAIDEVGGEVISFGILTTLAVALWSGSNAMGSMMTAFNLAFGVEEGRPFVKKKLVAVGLTVMLAVFVNLAFVLLVFGGRIGTWFADLIGAGGVFNVLWNLARWPIAIAAIAVILALLYYFGPYVEQSYRWISPGSIFATIAWLLATLGFGIYLRFSDPGSAYGVVGSLLVLLFFLYITAIVFITGAELNAVLAKRHDPETIQDLATKPEANEETRAQARSHRRRGDKRRASSSR